MAISTFDLFTVGIGPSSSHTVGPMRAAADFVTRLGDRVADVADLRVDLYGSLAATGQGHGTFRAVLLGLEGCRSDAILPSEVEHAITRITRDGTVRVGGLRPVLFGEQDLVLHPRTVLERHSNGMRFEALDEHGATIDSAVYYSIGGGFIEREGEAITEDAGEVVPLPFGTAAQLLAHCREQALPFSGVMLRNELATRSDQDVRAGILRLRDVMLDCIGNSVAREGVLPGGLNVRRRAPEWHRRLQVEGGDHDPAFWQEWVNFVALAVNEENATGGRIVTAPTNGAAGIIPAVLYYVLHFIPALRDASREQRDDAVVRYFLAAAAVGVLYKTQASISGAEVGCQGEVGSASSMAAAGLTEVLGGTFEQVENAAEIAMEHNLGLTCDPIGGLVQIPCIERNAIAAAKAINAAKMAMWGDGEHKVSLDEVIITMRDTGRDMNTIYKETSLGGLAVNVVEC